MPVSRRSFLGALKPGTAAFSPAFVAARGREALTAGALSATAPPPPPSCSTATRTRWGRAARPWTR